MQPTPWHIERQAKVTSTMDVARQKARAGAPHGTVVVAEEMTQGRGQQGHAWVAPPGGLYLSIVLRGLKDPHLLTLALGNAVAETLEVAGVEPRLKWVNDVLVGTTPTSLGKKIAGILVEGESTGSTIDFLVAGIGINVNGHAAALKGVESIATTLEDELHCDSCIPDLEALLLDAVDRWLGKVRDGHTREVLDAFGSRDALRGRKVRVDDGRMSVEGIADGIDDRGQLRIRTQTGTKAVASGTVSA